MQHWFQHKSPNMPGLLFLFVFFFRVCVFLVWFCLLFKDHHLGGCKFWALNQVLGYRLGRCCSADIQHIIRQGSLPQFAWQSSSQNRPAPEVHKGAIFSRMIAFAFLLPSHQNRLLDRSDKLQQENKNKTKKHTPKKTPNQPTKKQNKTSKKTKWKPVSVIKKER